MTDVLDRLQAVIDKVTGNRPSDAHFGMSIPASRERDLDLIASDAMTEIVRLREALTPSPETKAAYMGEFSVPLPESDGNGGEHIRRINVPWVTIKEIMAAIRARAAASEKRDGEDQ